MHEVLQRLSGGDRRSIGRANEVVALVLGEPTLFQVLFDGLATADPVLRMRCADAAEKESAGCAGTWIPLRSIQATLTSASAC